MTDIATPEEVAPSAEERIENAIQAASETQPSWKARCYRILGALGTDFGDNDDPDDLHSALSALKDENEMLREALAEAAEYLDGEGYYSEAGKYRAAIAQTEPGAADA